jgi:hypothetical protein
MCGRYSDETWEEPILAQVEGIGLDSAPIGAVIAALGGAPKARGARRRWIDRQIHVRHGASRGLEDDVYRERLRDLSEAKDSVERPSGMRVAARPGDQWLRAAPLVGSSSGAWSQRDLLNAG